MHRWKPWPGLYLCPGFCQQQKEAQFLSGLAVGVFCFTYLFICLFIVLKPVYIVILMLSWAFNGGGYRNESMNTNVSLLLLHREGILS